jgi:tRNA pseudouridine13 synthase
MADVPPIDLMAGIGCYCTKSRGIGGSIKQRNEGFKVSEVVADSLARDLSSSFDDQHRYPLFLLEKEGVDSNHALFEIAQKFHLNLRVMGIKDAKASTKQFAGSERVLRDPPKELKTAHTVLSLRGFTRKPLDKAFLAGNKFEITIYGPRALDLVDFVPEISKIGNFYGLQRFGSERLVTHLVGREIIRRNFDRAVDLLLSYTTEYDTPMSREIRERSSDPSNYRQLVRELPRGMDIERQLMSAIVAGKNAVSALRAVPITIRRLFVQAYQSFVFNKCLSKAVLSGADLIRPERGDLCFEMEGESTFGRIVKFENLASGQRAVPAVRMAGYTFQPGKGRFEDITKTILEEEGITPKDFHIKEMQELSQQGGFRQAPLWCAEFEYRTAPQLVMSFKLPKGSYATTLLRELLKPDDPIKAGF